MTAPTSYSTVDAFKERFKPRIFVGLCGDGVTADDAVAQGFLDKAFLEINIKIGTRYVTPVTNATCVAQLANLEEQIAKWFAYDAGGYGEQETAAAGAKVGYDNAMATLKMIASAQLNLTGATIVLKDEHRGGLWGGEEPHFDPLDTDSTAIAGGDRN